MPESRAGDRPHGARVEPRLRGGRAAPPIRRRDVYTEADGLFGRLADLVIENPLRSGGMVMVVTVIGAIIVNAAYFQTAHHPAPFFVTRADEPAAPADSVPAAPLPKSRATVAEPSRAAEAELAADPARLVADTQRALVGLRLYAGPIDGRFGPQTRAALIAFETAQHLPVTGQASAKLLLLLRKAVQKAADAAPAHPATPAASTIPTKADPVPPASIPDPAATGSISAPISPDSVKQVAQSLNAIGYGPIRVDDKDDPALAEAVRRFQTDNGLAASGKVDTALIAKLVAIGAMQSR